MNLLKYTKSTHGIGLAIIILCYTILTAFGIIDYMVGLFRLGSILCLWYFLGLILLILLVRGLLKDDLAFHIRLLATFFCVLVIFFGIYFSLKYRYAHGIAFSSRMYLKGYKQAIEKDVDLDCIYKWIDNISKGTVRRIDPAQFPECVKRLNPGYVSVGADKDTYFVYEGFPGAWHRVVPKGIKIETPPTALIVKGGYIELSKK